MILPSNQRQHRTLHIQKDALPYSAAPDASTAAARSEAKL
jgi:hypothetical protein